MSSRRSSRPVVGVILAVTAMLGFACNEDEDDDQFRRDVLWCEEALARLDACCPDFDATRVECNHYFGVDKGCASETTRTVEPALTSGESDCIRETSCDALVKNGVCARALQARAPSSVTTKDETGVTRDPQVVTRGPLVCP